MAYPLQLLGPMERVGVAFILAILGFAHLGCSSSLRSPSGAAGSAGGLGGGGAAGIRFGATGGLGGVAGSSALGGAGGGSCTVARSDDGTCGSRPDLAYPILPWTPVSAALARGGASGQDAGASSCQSRPSGFGAASNVSCIGPARLSATGGGTAGAGGANISFDDGTVLQWRSGDPALHPPVTYGDPDKIVAIDFENRWQQISTSCDGPTETVDIRDAADGSILYMEREAHADPTPDELIALFGVAADSVTACAFDSTDCCATTHQTVSDHVLQTTPPQTIPHDKTIMVTSPKGTFSVRWFARTEQTVGPGEICNCAAQLPSVDFIASRLAAP